MQAASCCARAAMTAAAATDGQLAYSSMYAAAHCCSAHGPGRPPRRGPAPKLLLTDLFETMRFSRDYWYCGPYKCGIIVTVIIIFRPKPTSTKPQARKLKLNNVNGCDNVSCAVHCVPEGDRIPLWSMAFGYDWNDVILSSEKMSIAVDGRSRFLLATPDAGG